MARVPLTEAELAKIERLLSEVRPDGGWIFGDDGSVGRSFGRQDTWVLSEQEAEFLTDLADAAPSLLSEVRSARRRLRENGHVAALATDGSCCDPCDRVSGDPPEAP